MPLNSTRGAGSAKGFGLTSGGFKEYSLDLLVVGGGGSFGGFGGGRPGGGGAGGFRLLTSQPFKGPQDVTIGGGGVYPASGVDSSFGNITAAGGGGGNVGPPDTSGTPGGSGGGGGGYANVQGGTGNTPPVSPPQGNPGFQGQQIPSAWTGSGGGGAGSGGPITTYNQPGGSGSPATPVFGASPQPFYLPDVANTGPTSGGSFAGGGGGGGCGPSVTNPGGTGGGGNGFNSNAGGNTAFDGRQNSGGGGGGTHDALPGTGSGGSGIVLVKAPTTASITVTPGTNTVTTVPGPSPYQVAKFTVTGTFLAK